MRVWAFRVFMLRVLELEDLDQHPCDTCMRHWGSPKLDIPLGVVIIRMK